MDVFPNVDFIIWERIDPYKMTGSLIKNKCRLVGAGGVDVVGPFRIRIQIARLGEININILAS